MEIPDLPTDNLYKFISIFGLIICLYSITIPFLKLNSIEIEVQNNNGEANLLEQEVKSIEGDDRAIDYKIREIRNELGKYKYDTTSLIIDLEKYKKQLYKKDYRDYIEFINKYEEIVFPVTKKIKELDSLVEKQKSNKREIQKKLILVSNKNNLASLKIKQTKRLLNYSIMGLALGSILVVFGFAQWYLKIQKPLDAQLKK